MANGDHLKPPDERSSEQQEELWLETWKRLDRFLPQLYGELFPEEAKKGPWSSFTRKEKPAPAADAAVEEKQASQEVTKEKEEAS